MTTTASRLVRVAVVAVLLLLAVPAAPASAAGTGGIEVTPVPGVVDGEQVTAFHVRLPRSGAREVDFALRNLTADPRSARLYAAEAHRTADGAFTVGAAGSSPYVVLPDEQVRLPGRALERRTFTVRGSVTGTTYAAVVLEGRKGSVVTRAATLVYLEPAPAASPSSSHRALLLGVVGVVVLGLIGLVVVLLRRRRRAEEEDLTEQARHLAGDGPVRSERD